MRSLNTAMKAFKTAVLTSYVRKRPGYVLLFLISLFIVYAYACYEYFSQNFYRSQIFRQYPTISVSDFLNSYPKHSILDDIPEEIRQRQDPSNYPHSRLQLPPLDNSGNKLQNLQEQLIFPDVPRRKLHRTPTDTPLGVPEPGVIQSNVPCLVNSTLRGRSPEEGRWYNFSIFSYSFYAYSAFYDDRPSLNTPPAVRIIALVTKLEENQKAPLLYCRLVSESGKVWFTKFGDKPKNIGYGWPIRNREWLKETIFHCPLEKDSEIPVAVSVVTDEDWRGSCMPVEVMEKPANKEEFAICVQVVYDSPNPYLIIEWTELQRMLGVSKIGIYVMDNVDEKSLKVFKHYQDEGLIELRRSYTLTPSIQQFMLHGSPVINDCMYRNIYRSQHLLVIDFDEVIMPRSANNLSELMAQLHQYYIRTRGSAQANYVFGNQYFFLDLPPLLTESPYLTMLRYRHRSAPSAYGYAVKSIIEPESCVNMHNHYCWSVTPGFKDRAYVEVANETFAINQHYKHCHLNETECAHAKKNYELDRNLERYLPTLRDRIKTKVQAILGHNI